MEQMREGSIQVVLACNMFSEPRQEARVVATNITSGVIDQVVQNVSDGIGAGVAVHNQSSNFQFDSKDFKVLARFNHNGLGSGNRTSGATTYSAQIFLSTTTSSIHANKL